jgi:SAM-dependent methyltransferase
VLGDAEALPFPAERFDAVLSIFGVMFAPDQPRAARELLRVARPGATIALANWTPAGFVGQMLKTVTRHVPPPAGVSSPLLWGTEARLRELFGDCVSSLTARPTEVVFRFRSPAEYVEVFRRFYGPVLKAFETVGEAGAPALHADLVALARQFDRGGGAGVAIPAQYLEVIAVRA